MVARATIFPRFFDRKKLEFEDTEYTFVHFVQIVRKY